jgi:hypothetical protein
MSCYWLVIVENPWWNALGKRISNVFAQENIGIVAGDCSGLVTTETENDWELLKALLY